MFDKAMELLPATFRETAVLRLMTFLKIPLIYYTQPRVMELNDQRCVVKIPLTRRTRNHLNSMYFGTLCVGADCAGGLMAMRLIQRGGNKLNLVFKDVQGEFLQRAEGDVHFICEDGDAISDLIEKATVSGERENLPVKINAVVPARSPEPVARFTLTLSIKKRGAAL